MLILNVGAGHKVSSAFSIHHIIKADNLMFLYTHNDISSIDIELYRTFVLLSFYHHRNWKWRHTIKPNLLSLNTYLFVFWLQTYNNFSHSRSHVSIRYVDDVYVWNLALYVGYLSRNDSVLQFCPSGIDHLS